MLEYLVTLEATLAAVRKNQLEYELEKAQRSKGAMVLHTLEWPLLVGGFVGFTLLSMLGDMTPLPGDGTLFGELAGMFFSAFVLKVVRALTKRSE